MSTTADPMVRITRLLCLKCGRLAPLHWEGRDVPLPFDVPAAWLREAAPSQCHPWCILGDLCEMRCDGQMQIETEPVTG